MAVSNKNIQMLPGYRKPLKGGSTHFVILTSQFSSSNTSPVTRLYVDTAGGGIGIIGTAIDNDLVGVIVGDTFTLPYAELYASYRAASRSNLDLPSSISSMISSSGFVTASISGLAISDLHGFYRSSFSGVDYVDSYIYGVPPSYIEAQLLGVSGVDVVASISGIAPVSLSGNISGVPFSSLGASISHNYRDNITALYSPYHEYDLEAEISGTGSGTLNLFGSIIPLKGQGVEYDLNATLSGLVSSTGDLPSYVVGYIPPVLSGYIESVPPVDLPAYVNPVPSGFNLQATWSGILPSGSLPASIIATGGYENLHGYLFSGEDGHSDLICSIDGTGASDLFASIKGSANGLLGATINISGTDYANLLEASVYPVVSSTLEAEYIPVIGNVLNASYEANPGAILTAVITPKVFFIDSTIPINTYPLRELKAVINTNPCGFSSSYKDLQVIIEGISSNDLEAKIVAIAGQYAVAHDELQFFIKNKVISEDWIPFIIDQPGIVENELPIILTNSPIKDLQASITGVQESADLGASISSIYFSGVLRDSKSTVEWVNTKTGERKIVRLYFKGDSINFYYSDAALDSYTLSPDEYLEIEIESYDKVESEENSYVLEKTSVKKCRVDNLTEFDTIDDAIKYGIMCAVSELHDDLRANIVGRGGASNLQAEINPLISSRLRDLPAKYFPTATDPTISATIEHSGGFSDLYSFIRGTHTSSTNTGFSDTMGEKYIPKFVVHGTGEVSIVLTKVHSTDRILIESPDLSASVLGVAEDVLSATISGS